MEWEIKKSSNGCLFCNKEFSEDEEYYSALFDENNTFLRKDFCTPCWNKGKEGGPFSFWKTKVPKKDKPVQNVYKHRSLARYVYEIGRKQRNSPKKSPVCTCTLSDQKKGV